MSKTYSPPFEKVWSPLVLRTIERFTNHDFCACLILSPKDELSLAMEASKRAGNKEAHTGFEKTDVFTDAFDIFMMRYFSSCTVTN